MGEGVFKNRLPEAARLIARGVVHRNVARKLPWNTGDLGPQGTFAGESHPLSVIPDGPQG